MVACMVRLPWVIRVALAMRMKMILSVILIEHTGAYIKGRPGRPWTPLVSDCKWCRTVNGVGL